MAPPSLKEIALALLAQREQSVSEMRRKLMNLSRGGLRAPAAANPVEDAAVRVEEVIAWLCAHRYLSEERFVESRVNARAARYGNLRIRRELAQHGLALSSDASQALKDSELDRAVAVWRRKFGTPAGNMAERGRQSRFLAARGFSSDVIMRVLRQGDQWATSAENAEDPAADSG